MCAIYEGEHRASENVRIHLFFAWLERVIAVVLDAMGIGELTDNLRDPFHSFFFFVNIQSGN